MTDKANLNPEIEKHLAAFKKRRRKLLLMRGLCAVALVLLVGMSAVAMIDRLLIVPDSVRYALSGIVYAVALWAFWKETLKFTFTGTRPKELAKLVEQADPGHREALLSAVELANAETSADSEEFRQLVQTSAASRLRSANADELLPTKLVGRWIALAVLAVLGVGALFFVPGLKFESLMARAFLPGANIERPSSILIKLLEPSADTPFVIAGEEGAISATAKGGLPKRMWVETRGADGELLKVEMKRKRGGQFSIPLVWSEGTNRIRLRTRDAISKFYDFAGVERPAVVSFTKVYEFPEYTRRDPLTVAEEGGGELQAIEGSTCRITFTLNQEVGEAEVNLLRPGEEEPEVLTSDNGSVEIPVSGEFDRYNVRLVGSETGFENTFRPDFEIRAMPDLPPAIDMVEPAASMEVAPDDRVKMTGSAIDDVGLEYVARAFQIDGKSWKEETLIEPEGVVTNKPLDLEWPLAPHRLKSGQVISLKLVTVDLKGQRAESRTVRLVVKDDKAARERREWAKKNAKFAKEVKDLSEQLQKTAESMREAEQSAKKQMKERQSEDQQKLARAASEASAAKQLAEEAVEKAREMMAEAPTESERREMEAVAERLNAMKERELDAVADAARQQVSAPRNEEKTRRLDRPVTDANRAREEVRKLSENVDALAADDMAEVAAEEAKEFAESAKELAKNNEKGDALKAEKDILEDRGEDLLKTAEELEPLVENNVARDLQKRAEELEESMEKMATDPSGEKPDSKAPQELAKRADQFEKAMERVEKSAEKEAAKARDELFGDRPDPAEDLEKLVQDANFIAQKEKQKEALNNPSKQQVEALENDIAARKEGLAKELDEVADELRGMSEQAALPESSRDDAAALNEAAQALEAMEDKVRESESFETAQENQEQLAKLGDAVNTLEAAAEADSVAEVLDEMKKMESSSPESRERGEENPELFAAAEAEMEDLKERLQDNAASEEMKKDSRELADGSEAKRVEQEMKRRETNDSHKPQNLSEPIASMQEKARELQEDLAPKAEEAKQAISEMAPTIPEQMRNLAEEMNEQSEELEGIAKNDDATPPADATSDLAEAMAENAERAEEIESALMAEANQEDLSTAESRETARDADDALAQMQNLPVEEPAAQLEEAMQADGENAQNRGLEKAAETQEEMASALNEIAEQMEQSGMEGSEAEDARTALRSSEEESGVKDVLDSDYAQAEDLAEMMEQAQSDPAALMEALEAELAENPAMQESLEQIAATAAQEAAEALDEAAAAEGALSEAVQQSPASMPAQAGEQAQIGENVSEAGEDLARAGRHQERMGNTPMGEAMQQTGQSTEQVAANEAAAAQESLAESAPPQEAGEMLDAAQGAIAEQAEAARDLAEAAMEQAATSPTAFDPQAMQLAMALDALDQQMAEAAAAQQSQSAQNQQPSQGSESQSGQQGTAEEASGLASEQSAQAALAEAMNQQAMAMTKSRSLGFPGQQGQPSQQGEQPSQSEGQTPAMAASDRGADLETFGEGLEGLAELAESEDGAADWSRLPKKLAEDIRSGREQEMSPDYRYAIESYFKAIAEETRKE